MRARGTVEKGLVRVSARDRDGNGNGNGRGLGCGAIPWDEGSDERKEEKAAKWTETEGDNALCFDSRSVHAQGCTSHWPAFEFCTPCTPIFI